MLLNMCVFSTKSLQQNRPKARVYNRAICQNGTDVEFVSQGAVGGIVNHMREGHLKHWKLENHPAVKVGL